jgi:hypothetical protein
MQGRPGSHPLPTRRDWWWIFDPRCSLRARAALTIGAGVVVLALFLSWITSALHRRALETHLAATFETLAFQVGDKLDRAVYERYRTLQLAASLATIRDTAAPPADRRRVLEVVQETTPEFAWLGLTDSSGRIVAGTQRRFEGAAHDQSPWFREGRERPFIGGLHEIAELARDVTAPDDGERPRRFLDLAVPVTGANGQFAGVIAAHVRWNWSREVQMSVVPEAAARNQIGVTVYGPGRDVLLDSGASGWTQPPEAPAVGEGRRFRGTLVEPTGGTTYFTGYSRSRGIREYRGIGWLTVVRQPVERAFASVASLRRAIVFWGGVLAAGAAAAGWIIAGRHARKLRSVRAAAERIHEGDILSVLPRPKGESELAGMCGALGDLVEDLRAKQEKLTAENARLAAQLRENESAKQ